MINKKHYLQMIIVFMLAAASSILYNFTTPQGIPLVYHPLQLESGALLTSDQAYGLFRNGRALFIDARSAAEYNENHIHQAINLPIHSSRDDLNTMVQSLSKGQLIVAYCSNPACNSSRRLAGLLSYLGFSQVYIYLPGIEEWQSLSYPTDTGRVGDE